MILLIVVIVLVCVVGGLLFLGLYDSGEEQNKP